MKNIQKLPFILTILSFLTIFAPVNAEIKGPGPALSEEEAKTKFDINLLDSKK